MSNRAKTWLIDSMIVVLMTTLMYGLFLGTRPLAAPDEGRYSEIPREMIVTKDYLTPHLNGVQYFEKPVLFYWLQAISIKLFGLQEWSLRLANAMMGGLGVLTTYLAARTLFNRRVGLISGLLLSTSLLYGLLSRFITIDVTMTFFLTACLLLFIIANQYPEGQKRRWCLISFYIFAALATLTKGLIGVIFPGSIIFVWLLLTNEWQRVKTYFPMLGILFFLIITCPWHILVGITNPSFFKFYFYEQHFLRYFTDYSGRSQAIWFLPAILLGGWFPWTPFLLAALKRYATLFKSPRHYSIEIFLLLWSATIFLFYWLSHSQLSPYLLPIFPPLAILTAKFLDEIWNENDRKYKRLFLVAAIFTTLLSAVFFFVIPIKHIVVPFTIYAVLLTVSTIGALACYYTYRKYSFKSALIALCISNFFLSTGIYCATSFIQLASVKQLALELKKQIQPEDIVYNYNHYFQDMPLYLERTVSLLNWKGELEFGSRHNPPSGTFLPENAVWDNWQESKRKFVVMKIQDFQHIKNTYKQYKFYELAKNRKFVVISNKEPLK